MLLLLRDAEGVAARLVLHVQSVDFGVKQFRRSLQRFAGRLECCFCRGASVAVSLLLHIHSPGFRVKAVSM